MDYAGGYALITKVRSTSRETFSSPWPQIAMLIQTLNAMLGCAQFPDSKCLEVTASIALIFGCIVRTLRYSHAQQDM